MRRHYAIARRGIAYVPEGRGIFASLSVAENIAIAERQEPTARRSGRAAGYSSCFRASPNG